MLRTETNSALANPSAAHFTDSRRDEQPQSGEHATVGRAPLAEVHLLADDFASGEFASRRNASGGAALGSIALGDFALGEAASGEVDLRGIVGKTEAELSWALAASTPLAVLGATLLAHGSTLPSDLCLGLGTLSILTIFGLQIRARMRVRGIFAAEAVAQGLPSSLGRKQARKYMNAWFR